MKTTDKKTETLTDIEKNISGEIKMIRAKLDINASDWSKAEKEAIAKSYHEITRFSTGRGRPVDTGCSSCVSNAVTIIKNFLAAIGKPVKDGTVKPARKAVALKDNDTDAEAGINDDEHLFAPKNKDWRKNHDSISEAAAELEYTFAENEVTKAERVAALEKHITEINK